MKDLSTKLEESKKLTNNMKKESLRNEKESILSKKTFENKKAKYEKIIVELNEELKVDKEVVVSETENIAERTDELSTHKDPKTDPSSLAPNTLPKSLSTSSQTLASQDVPYSINEPLPPIFSSQLFHHSKPIRFLSRSLRSLDSICWGKRNDTLEDLADQAEEALYEPYDREIRDFYVDERECVKTERLSSPNFDLNLNIVLVKLENIFPCYGAK